LVGIYYKIIYIYIYNTMPKNNLPLYFEELKLKEENLTLSLSDLLTQFKQQIPINYLEINLEEGNYGGSTNPK